MIITPSAVYNSWAIAILFALGVMFVFVGLYGLANLIAMSIEGSDAEMIAFDICLTVGVILVCSALYLKRRTRVNQLR